MTFPLSGSCGAVGTMMPNVCYEAVFNLRLESREQRYGVVALKSPELGGV